MNDKCILLIDDDEAIREVVQMGIEIEADWQVLSACSGIDGIAMAENQQPDVILLDVMMPEMDGIQTLSKLKTNRQTKLIPVIFFTAKTQGADKTQFQDLGVIGVITKPFNSMTIASRVAQMLHWEY